MSLARPTTLFALAAALALPSLAAAQEKADLQVLVASVSNAGKEVAPELKGMEADFKRSGLAFTSFKLLGRNTLALKVNETGTVKLPNGLAKFTLVKLEGPKATVKFDTPGLKNTQTMTPGGETYIDAGAHAGAKVWLAVKR